MTVTAAFPWQALEEAIVRDHLKPDLNARCAAAVPPLDDYAAASLFAALRRRGVFADAGTASSDDEIAAALRAVPDMAKLLSAALDVLARQGWIAPVAGGFCATDKASHVAARRAEAARLLARDHADKSGIVAVIDGTVPRLPEVIGGDLQPTEVIFPEGSMDLVLGYYRGHPLADTLNRLCALAIAHLAAWFAAARDPARPVRLIEVGAGTGTTTAAVLAELGQSGVPVEYTFTDVSGVFVGRAQRTLGRVHPTMRFARYDIEAPPPYAAAEGGFDIVLAANAVHATADIAASLRHLAARLAPGGILVLNEITAPQDHLTLAFGMLPGWWRAVDRRSAAGPLLTAADWRERLEPLFDIRLIAGPGDPENPLQSLIVASLRAGSLSQS